MLAPVRYSTLKPEPASNILSMAVIAEFEFCHRLSRPCFSIPNSKWMLVLTRVIIMRPRQYKTKLQWHCFLLVYPYPRSLIPKAYLSSREAAGVFSIAAHVFRDPFLKTCSLSDCNWTRTHNHLVHKQTLNHLAKLAYLGKFCSCRVWSVPGPLFRLPLITKRCAGDKVVNLLQQFTRETLFFLRNSLLFNSSYCIFSL